MGLFTERVVVDDYGKRYTKTQTKTFNVALGCVVLATLTIIALMAALPVYNVWKLELRGKAELKQAEWNRQIAIQEAEARKQSAVLLAEAEVERARGVAKANEIIADGLKGNEEYLRYLWIDGLQTNDQQVIYVPTEAGLPILEAGKR